jgi:hypothetical protein
MVSADYSLLGDMEQIKEADLPAIEQLGLTGARPVTDGDFLPGAPGVVTGLDLDLVGERP